jgi:hypothetical protein
MDKKLSGHTYFQSETGDSLDMHLTGSERPPGRWFVGEVPDDSADLESSGSVRCSRPGSAGSASACPDLLEALAKVWRIPWPSWSRFYESVSAVINRQNLVFKEVARGGEPTRVLLISFIFSFSPLYR